MHLGYRRLRSPRCNRYASARLDLGPASSLPLETATTIEAVELSALLLDMGILASRAMKGWIPDKEDRKVVSSRPVEPDAIPSTSVA